MLTWYLLPVMRCRNWGGLNRSQLAGSNGIGFAASDKLEGRLKNRFRRPLRMIAGLAYAP